MTINSSVYLLLPFFESFTTGCEADLDIKACTGGWFQFTCNCKMKTCPAINIKNPRRNVCSTNVNTWEQDKNIFLYHDTEEQLLRVKVKTLTRADSGDYKCKINKDSKTKVELKLKQGKKLIPLISHSLVFHQSTLQI